MNSEKQSFGNKEEKFSSFILYAPKLKLKKPTISPTPFILNNSEMDDDNNTTQNSEQSFDDKDYNDLIIFPN